jgi:hypothetical protein
LLDSHTEAIVSQALALAEKGDAQVLRILLGHILPRRRELPLKTGPLPMGTAAELSQVSQRLMNKVTSGQIGLRDAKGIADLLEQRRQILETENLEKRVRAIEQKTDDKERQLLRRYDNAKITRNNHAITRVQSKAPDLSERFPPGRRHCHTIATPLILRDPRPGLHCGRQSAHIPDVPPNDGRRALFLRYLNEGPRVNPAPMVLAVPIPELTLLAPRTAGPSSR